MTSNQSHPRGSTHKRLQACPAAAHGKRSHQLSNDSLKLQTTCLFFLQMNIIKGRIAAVKLSAQPYGASVKVTWQTSQCSQFCSWVIYDTINAISSLWYNNIIRDQNRQNGDILGKWGCLCCSSLIHSECVVQVLPMLLGHKPVYTVTLWGLVFLMGTKKQIHHNMIITCFKV